MIGCVRHSAIEDVLRASGSEREIRLSSGLVSGGKCLSAFEVSAGDRRQ